MDDAQVVTAVLSGDREKYRELVERHEKMVYAIAWSQLGNRELSEDAAQDAFIQAFRALGSRWAMTQLSCSSMVPHAIL